MRLAISFLLASCAPFAAAQDMPKNIRVSTWVREDLFAGYLDGDMTRFKQGVQKLDRILAANPKAADVLAWKGDNLLFLGVRAYEAGNAAAFDAEYRKALELFAQAAAITKQAPPPYRAGVFAITGGGFTVMADRMPPKYRREAWTKVRENYTALREAQKETFDKLPVHFRGEVMAGLAQAAQRLGEKENAKALTQELVTALPGTPYAVFGKRWLDKPATMATSKVTCVSCHDPGRLHAMLNAAPKK